MQLNLVYNTPILSTLSECPGLRIIARLYRKKIGSSHFVLLRYRACISFGKIWCVTSFCIPYTNLRLRLHVFPSNVFLSWKMKKLQRNKTCWVAWLLHENRVKMMITRPILFRLQSATFECICSTEIVNITLTQFQCSLYFHKITLFAWLVCDSYNSLHHVNAA